MFEWLKERNPEQSISWDTLVFRLLMSWLAGLIVVAIYRFTRRNSPSSTTIAPTLVLLSILVAMVTQVIGDSAARAFSLVGALSIVRFRTVVEDTHDIAFVIFSVVVGMAFGSDHWLVAGVGIIVVGSAASLMRPKSVVPDWTNRESTLYVRVGIGREPDEILSPTFGKLLESYSLVAGASGRQGTAFDLTYKIRFRLGASPTALLDELNRVEGVQSVELKRES